MMPVKRKSAFSAKSVAKTAAASTPTKSEPTSTPPPSKSEFVVIIPNFDVTNRKKVSNDYIFRKEAKKEPTQTAGWGRAQISWRYFIGENEDEN